MASGDLAGEMMVWDTQRGVQIASYDFRRPGVHRTMDRIASLSWFPSATQLCLGISHRKICSFWPICNVSDTARSLLSPPCSSSSAPSMDHPAPACAVAIAQHEQQRRELKRQLEQDDDEIDGGSSKRAKLGETAATSHAAATLAVDAAPTPLALDWSALSARIQSCAAPSSSSKPIPMLKSPTACRFIHFHANGEYLLLAERTATPTDTTGDAHTDDRHSLTLRVYSMDARKFTVNASSQKQEMRVLAELTHLLFFSESGIAIHGDRLATCQWYSPPAHAPPTGAGVYRPRTTATSLVPTLAVFSLLPGRLGECLARLELNAYSFSDLTCVAFSPGAGDVIAVAYQLANRAKRRQTRRASDQHAQRDNDTAPRTRHAGSSRFSALSELTQMTGEEKEENTTTTLPSASSSRPDATRVALHASPIAASLSAVAPSSTFRPSSTYASRLSESLEDHTFLALYRSADLLPLRQMTAPRTAAATHSVNAIVYSAMTSVGILAGATNGDIMACTPMPIDDERATETAAATPHVPFACEFAGRHRVPAYVRDEVYMHAADAE